MTEDQTLTDSIRYSPPAVMTIDEVAVYLGFAEATVRRMLRDREIPAAKVAGQWRFLKAEVDRWLEDLSAKTLSSPALPGFDWATCLNLSKRILESFPGDATAENIAKIILLSAELAKTEDSDGLGGLAEWVNPDEADSGPERLPAVETHWLRKLAKVTQEAFPDNRGVAEFAGTLLVLVEMAERNQPSLVSEAL